MKNFSKLFIVASILFAFSAVATAQEWQVGDTILIKKECQKYLTGEKPSTWVYFVEHSIQQVGGKRFPEGLLIKGIYSWLGKDDVVNKSDQEREKARRAAELEERADKARLEQEAAEHGAQLLEGEEGIQGSSEDSTLTQGWEVEGESQVAEQDSASAEKAKALRKAGWDRFSIGVRGGVAADLQKSGNKDFANWKPGFDCFLDLQYAHYFGSRKKVNCGILTGVGIGFARNAYSVNQTDSTLTLDGLNGDTWAYNVKADNIKEYDMQLQIEVPLMFSLITEKGLFFNIGPKLIINAWNPYTQKANGTNVEATLTDSEWGTNYTLVNNGLTGTVENGVTSKGKWNNNLINVSLGAELGYEWFFKNGNSLGLGVYGNYALLSNKLSGENGNNVVDVYSIVAPSTSTGSVAPLISATDATAKSTGFFDAGLKLAYHFNFFKK